MHRGSNCERPIYIYLFIYIFIFIFVFHSKITSDIILGRFRQPMTNFHVFTAVSLWSHKLTSATILQQEEVLVSVSRKYQSIPYWKLLPNDWTVRSIGIEQNERQKKFICILNQKREIELGQNICNFSFRESRIRENDNEKWNGTEAKSV